MAPTKAGYMKNQQILEKAIHKALDNGWLASRKFKSFKRFSVHWAGYPEESLISIQQYYSTGDLHPRTEAEFDSHYDILFNHDFAKALWGEEDQEFPDSYKGTGNVEFYDFGGPKYLYRLIHMVVAEDPIAYLGESLK